MLDRQASLYICCCWILVTALENNIHTFPSSPQLLHDSGWDRNSLWPHFSEYDSLLCRLQPSASFWSLLCNQQSSLTGPGWGGEDGSHVAPPSAWTQSREGRYWLSQSRRLLWGLSHVQMLLGSIGTNVNVRLVLYVIGILLYEHIRQWGVALFFATLEQLIRKCWCHNATMRPTFEQVKKSLDKMNPHKVSPVDMMMNLVITHWNKLK